MYEVRTQVPPGDHWQETDAKLMEVAGRPNDFLWANPKVDNGTRNRGWVVKSFIKARLFMKKLGKVSGVTITLREATNRDPEQK